MSEENRTKKLTDYDMNRIWAQVEGRWLLDECDKQGRSHAGIARALGVSSVTLHNYIYSVYGWRQGTFTMICEELGVDPVRTYRELSREVNRIAGEIREAD